MLKSGLLALSICAALALPARGASVASADTGAGRFAASPTAGDYFISLNSGDTCTGNPAGVTTCGFLLALNPTSTKVTTPSSTFFGCTIYNGTQPVEDAYVNVPSTSGAVSGAAGVTGGAGSTVSAVTFLSGRSTGPYQGLGAGAPAGIVSNAGTASGLVSINDTTRRLTGGIVRITVSGTIANYLTHTFMQGSLSCSISPGQANTTGFATSGFVP